MNRLFSNLKHLQSLVKQNRCYSTMSLSSNYHSTSLISKTFLPTVSLDLTNKQNYIQRRHLNVPVYFVGMYLTLVEDDMEHVGFPLLMLGIIL